MLRRRRAALGWALVLAATAVASAAVATRQADAQDRERAQVRLAAVRLQLLPAYEVPEAPAFGSRGEPVFALAVRNAGSTGIVVAGARWRQHDVALDLAVDAGQDQFVLLPQPPDCPTHRVTAATDHLDLVVAAAGGRRTVRLALPDPLGPGQEINTRCGLYRAAESAQAVVRAVRSRPGEVVLDVSVAFLGALPTEVLAVRAGAGVGASVAERLPVTLAGAPDVSDGREVPHLLTVTLRRLDCAALVPFSTLAAHGELQPAPGYDQLQLEARHPGDPVERVNLGYPTEAANTLAAGCGLPRLEPFEGS